MQLANGLITGLESIEARIHLRNEFSVAGLDEIMPDLHTFGETIEILRNNVSQETGSLGASRVVVTCA